ncbi:hypothetical protein [Paenibacillus chitinolyticus]|uniref:hypothetical protein n=1 Tax=Paenibacillus chitinolyticus TaxID=79263 RepID=UPI001C487157|nr:hypothetical protein [Paenibacillus chitinolyticus]MBV6712534.1 hypothetical protein [Paenibacillus chitinolyticus]
MYSIKSPGGSLFPYYYKGGEIHCLKYGSFFQDEAGLFKLMLEEEHFSGQRSQELRIWVDFYETRLSDDVIAAFVDHIGRLNAHIYKLTLVGCSFGSKLKLKKRLNRLDPPLKRPVSFFSDPEVAKTWLVREG